MSDPPTTPSEYAQKFGGQWSILKVEAVEKYLRGFVTALKNSTFTLVYIDTFAGSGSFTFGKDVPAIPTLEADRNYAGSVKRALAVSEFKELYFLENDPRNLASLRAITELDPRAKIIAGDANIELVRLCQELSWKRRRGVVFVDPYGPETNWSMMRAIAATQALDMFWLFPLSAVYRNAPKKHHLLTPDKRAMVTRCLGADDWEQDFYAESTAAVGDLFADAPRRLVNTLRLEDIEAYVAKKLREVGFAHVERPGRIHGPTNAPLFSLFFAVSNPNPKAIKPASAIAGHILKSL